jgi:hypothetical protein
MVFASLVNHCAIPPPSPDDIEYDKHSKHEPSSPLDDALQLVNFDHNEIADPEMKIVHMHAP